MLHLLKQSMGIFHAVIPLGREWEEKQKLHNGYAVQYYSD